MILGDRCQYMLANSTQCSNPALRTTDLCLLHTQIRENDKLIASENDALAQKEQQAQE